MLKFFFLSLSHLKMRFSRKENSSSAAPIQFLIKFIFMSNSYITGTCVLNSQRREIFCVS